MGVSGMWQGQAVAGHPVGILGTPAQPIVQALNQHGCVWKRHSHGEMPVSLLPFGLPSPLSLSDGWLPFGTVAACLCTSQARSCCTCITRDPQAAASKNWFKERVKNRTIMLNVRVYPFMIGSEICIFNISEGFHD